MRNITRKIVLSELCLLVIAGCSQRPADMPKLYHVTAMVMMSEKPLEGALVSCVPENNGAWFSGGMTDANGHIRFQTKGRYDGIPLGHFKVIITKSLQTSDSTPEKARFARLVHSKYEDLATTPLTCIIEKNTRAVEFNVEPAPPNDFIKD